MVSFKVSVIIPFYNSEKYIERAILSCIELDAVGEIICINDGSTDDSYSIVNQLKLVSSKIVLLQHPDKKNHGRSASRNLGIKNAQYDYIAFLDSDDEYAKRRFENEKDIFLNDSTVDGVYGIVETKFESSQSQIEFEKRFDSNIIRMGTEAQPDNLYKYLINGGHGFFQTDALTIKKSALKKTGLFSTELVIMEDTHLWIRLAAKCKLVSNNDPKPVAYYHIHTTNSVIQSDDLHSKALSTLGLSLFKWALKQKDFSYDKKNDFFIGHKKMYPEESDLKTLAKFIIRHPVFLLNKFVWHKLIQIVK